MECWGAELLCQDKLKSQIDTTLKMRGIYMCVYENINFNLHSKVSYIRIHK